MGAVTPMPMTPVASPTANVLHRAALGRVGLDRLTGPAWECCGCRDLRREGSADRDGRGEGKSFQSHVSSLLDIDWPGMCPGSLYLRDTQTITEWLNSG